MPELPGGFGAAELRWCATTHLRGAWFFTRLSVVWSITYLLNAGGSVWLLTSSSLDGFLLSKSVLSPAGTLAVVLISYGLFRLTVRHQNVQVRWAHHQPWTAAPA